MSTLPVVIIGAGPSGLAAAAQLRSRGQSFLVLEAGESVGAAVQEWGHVRLFSPWSELTDPVARILLVEAGWEAPEDARYPTGADWVAMYLQPLAELLGPDVRVASKVVGVTKIGRDLLVDSGRDDADFVVRVETPHGVERIEASAVIDASGTWTTPNPLGGDGLRAIGELEASHRISYRMPNLRAADARSRYVGKHVAVAGTGASAKGTLIGLAELIKEDPTTRVTWLVRRASVGPAFAGSEDDELEQRGALGRQAQEAVVQSGFATVNGFRTAEVVVASDDKLSLISFDGQVVNDVDEVIVLTGFRPDLSFLSEIRLDLDPALQAPRVLAPLIDPNVHSCGTVYPHGAKELIQPETNFFLVGMKAYGRATSFLALTGFEQVRSVVAEVTGDHEAAARVELTLPETGVCGGSGAFDEDEVGGGCCGASEPQLLSISANA